MKTVKFEEKKYFWINEHECLVYNITKQKIALITDGAQKRNIYGRNQYPVIKKLLEAYLDKSNTENCVSDTVLVKAMGSERSDSRKTNRFSDVINGDINEYLTISKLDIRFATARRLETIYLNPWGDDKGPFDKRKKVSTAENTEKEKSPQNSLRTTDNFIAEETVTLLSSEETAFVKSTRFWPRPGFVRQARADILARIGEKLAETNYIFLSGMGGIGKSEIAKTFAKEQKEKGIYKTVVFAQLDEKGVNRDIFSAVINDTVFITDQILRGEKETKEEYYQRKLGAIKQHCGADTLFIIDNYSGEDEYFDNFTDAEYHIIFTTRKNSDNSFNTVYVPEIKEKAYLKQIFIENITDKDIALSAANSSCLDSIIEILQHHTLGVELIARYVDATEQPLCDVYNQLKKSNGFVSLDGDVSLGLSQKEKTPFEWISGIFSLSELNHKQEYTDIMSFMAAMPVTGVAHSVLKKWTTPAHNSALKQLIRRSWVRREAVDNEQIYSLHPLIKEVVSVQLKGHISAHHAIISAWLDEDNVYINSLYHQDYQIKMQYLPVLTGLSEMFLNIADKYDFDIYSKLVRDLICCGEDVYSTALINRMQAEYSSRADKDLLWEYGYSLYLSGFLIYAISRNYPLGINLYEEAEKIMAATTNNDHLKQVHYIMLLRSLASALCGITFDLNSDKDVIESVEAYLKKGVNIADNLQTTHNINAKLYKGTVNIVYAKIALAKGDMAGFRQYICLANANFTEHGYINKVDKSALLEMEAFVCTKDGEHHKAAMKLEEALKIYQNSFGKMHSGNLGRYKKLAQAYYNDSDTINENRVLAEIKAIEDKLSATP